jgi:hypothetical protein
MVVAGLSHLRDTNGRPKIRVWTDQPDASSVSCRFRASLKPVAVDVVEVEAPPAVAAHPQYPRKVFELGGLPPDADILIRIGSQEARVRTLPEPGGPLRLLLGSCYYAYQAADPESQDNGAISRAYDALPEKPHLKILCGDQLYLDAKPLIGGVSRLEATFREYRRYFRQYDGFLSKGLHVFGPDDHEFWNDYPRAMPWLSRSWSGKWREHAESAMLAKEAFQSITNPEGRSWFGLDLGLVELFVTDLRSERSYRNRGRVVWDQLSESWREVDREERLCTPEQLAAIRDWAAGLQKPGLLVLGQPLFQAPETWSDRNIMSFEDEARAIWTAVEQAPRTVVVLAGDIHWARAGSWRVPRMGDRRFEVVASPMRLLKPFKMVFWTIGARKKLSDPRKDIPLAGPSDSARRRLEGAYGTSVDSFSLLTLRRRPGAVELAVETRNAKRVPATATDAFAPGNVCERVFNLV